MSTDNQKSKEYTFALSNPPGVPGINGVIFSQEALEKVVEVFKKRLQQGRYIVGEYDRPRSADLPERMLLSRVLTIDESRSALCVKNVQMTDQGIVGVVSPFGMFGDSVQKSIDSGEVDRGEVGFRIRTLATADNVVDGVVTDCIPVTVDFIKLK